MTEVPIGRLKQLTQKYGFDFGKSFSLIKKTWYCDNSGLALVDIGDSPLVQAESKDFIIHPSILDACSDIYFVRSLHLLSHTFLRLQVLKNFSSANICEIVSVPYSGLSVHPVHCLIHLFTLFVFVCL